MAFFSPARPLFPDFSESDIFSFLSSCQVPKLYNNCNSLKTTQNYPEKNIDKSLRAVGCTFEELEVYLEKFIS